MVIFRSERRMEWGALDVPMLGLVREWGGEAIQPPGAYSLVADPDRLWFVAHRQKPADFHPKARPGEFVPELWKHDVAELFLADPVRGNYFEFNLAPNGAWWCCEFTAPRQRRESIDIEMPDVATFADLAPDGSWMAAMALPLDILRARLDFGENTHLNVTMVVDSPQQRFLSASDFGGGELDFHRPGKFPQARFININEVMSATPPDPESLS